MKWNTALYFCLVSFSSVVQSNSDVTGSSDSEIVGRYPGSFISGFFTNEYAEVKMPLTTNSYDDNEKYNSLTVEGEQQIIIYDVPSNVTTSFLKVYRSLIHGLEKEGFTELFSCQSSKKNCGYFFPRYSVLTDRDNEVIKFYRSNFNGIDNYEQSMNDMAMYTGKSMKQGQEYLILLIAGKDSNSTNIQYSFEIIKSGELEVMPLTKASIASDIEKKGKAILTGLYFDHNKSTLKKESEPAFVTISNYLHTINDSFLVVGHTDSVGSYDTNLNLSRARAESVVDELITTYGIDKNRLRAVGISFASPAASNRTDEGKSLNRRVELVSIQ